MRVLFSILLLAGCAHRPADSIMHVVPQKFSARWIERDLRYWTARYSLHSTNHFYVGATEVQGGRLKAGLVFWKEERTIVFVAEPNPGASECMTWGHALKLDRDTVDTPEDSHGSTYLGDASDLGDVDGGVHFPRRALHSLRGARAAKLPSSEETRDGWR